MSPEQYLRGIGEGRSHSLNGKDKKNIIKRRVQGHGEVRETTIFHAFRQVYHADCLTTQILEIIF